MNNHSVSPFITVSAEVEYLEAHSQPATATFAFAYTITITNNSRQTVQLLYRHWNIKDGNQTAQTVYGKGVVGEQPHIKPGASYTYTSHIILPTEVGTMEGHYEMQTGNDNRFSVNIPAFALACTFALH